ncbi:hypothetical protein IC608_02715 [Devosia sp. PTR5]|uniref:Choice-of-anchor G family protein n=1 Tax=Devosia oryzisoli TaxID=2774138 RepID=A0A927FTD0_9HYPH|nr:hypothetical protein [Devosia oryzisoli]MBD8064388.1 hypothetical protein [Devosia oryzisoli]
MTTTTTFGRRGLAALAAAFLVSVALPADPALAAKVKDKSGSHATQQQAPDVSVEVAIPTIDAVDSSMDEAALADILKGNIAGHAEALAALDATSITVPSIVLSVRAVTDGEAEDTTVTFSDLVLSDVANGVAGSFSLGGVALDSKDATLSYGTLAASDLNIGGLLGFYGLVAAAEPGGGLQTIYTDFTADGGTVEAEDVSCTIGGVSVGEFKARPLKNSLLDMIVLAQTLEETQDTPDPVLVGKLLRMYADLFTAFESSEANFDGFSCDGTDEEDRPIVVAVDSMTVNGMTPGTYPGISVDGVDISVGDEDTIALDNFTFKPMDLTSVIATLEGAPDAVDQAWLDANARGLIPGMEGLSLSGLNIDVPDPEAPGTRIKASVGAFDLTLGDYRNGIPTTVDTSAANIVADLPADTEDEQLKQLIALGVTSIDAGFRIAASWDEAAQAIDLEEVSVTGADLATVVLAGKITNATEDLFATDPDTALMASMGLAVKSLNLDVTDEGLSDIILKAVAAEQGSDPAAMRPVFAGLAEGTVVGMMAGAADAAKLGKAVNSFVSGAARTLNISIEAKEDPGIGVADFMAAEEDPTLLLGKVTIDATAK